MSLRRAAFLTAVGAFGLTIAKGLDGDALDPADESRQQSLRVLLGTGSAQRIDDRSFWFEGRRYRGTFAVLQDGRVVTTVGLEDYLYSVVPREMPASWPAAALQAQAVIARTFVLQRSSPQREYDLVPSEADQVYAGMDGERPQSRAAVDATAGRVLRYSGRFALAMYSSCCGGHTESSSAAWESAPIPYLNGVACTNCAAAPWYEWKQQIEMDRLQTALSSYLPDGAQVQSVRPDFPDASGRAQTWTLAWPGGSARVPAAKVRSRLGTRVLPSLLVRKIDISPQAPRTVVIEGGGLGHGVGLCQWGARGLALAGGDAGSILAYYYPGTGIGND